MLELRRGSNSYFSVALYSNGRRRKDFLVHRLVWDAFGDKPRMDGLQVDHIDENMLNNRIDNLQLLTNRQNATKSWQTKRDLPTGACYNRSLSKYQSQITVNGKSKYLGHFNTPKEASQVYQKALKELI